VAGSAEQIEMPGVAFVPVCVKVHGSPPACCGPHSISNCQNSSLAELSDCSMDSRLRARRFTSAGKDRRQARRLNATGFAFAVVGRGELLMLLLFKAMLLLERARGRKAGGPPLLTPFFKVQGNTAHNQSSGFAVAPRVKGLNARAPLEVQQGNQLRPTRSR
jgi:hypothetical protein